MSIIEWIYPTKCVNCGQINKKYLCKRCRARLDFKIELNKKSYRNKNYKNHFYIFEYANLIREKIIQYKFNAKGYIYRFFTEMLLEMNEKNKVLNSYDYIIPVPISRKRMLKRGYNQTELIAKELSKKIHNIEMIKLIIKKKDNIAQSTLNAKERKENVKNVYEINKKYIDKIDINKRFIIFDDIYTTGSTVNEIAKTLKEAGIKNIDILTIAKD